MRKPFFAALLAMPLAISNAYATDDGGPSVIVTGYGTLAYTGTDTDAAEYGRPNQWSGVKKTFRNGVDSNFGIQGTILVNDWLSFTAQGLARKIATDDWSARLYWGFAKAKINKEWSVRIGRIGLPVYMISDFRNLGYANTFIRPPAEVYSQVVFDNVDGADVIYQTAFGDTSVTAQLAAGNTEEKVAAAKGSPTGAALGGNASIEGKSMWALNVVVENGPLTLRVGRAEASVKIDDSSRVNALLTGLRAAGTGYGFSQLNRLADDLAADGNKPKGSFTSLGLGLDWNNFVVQSEFAKRKTRTYIASTTSWYVLGGYRIGKFLPYAVHGSLRRDSVVANTVPTSCPAGYPAACTPTMQALRAGVTALTTTATQGEQSTTSLGVRWDFHKSAALKVQVDRVKPHNGQGLFLNPTPAFTGPVTVFAAGVDFVF
ncbi:MAG TPA: hypothetical protein VEC06_14850 [Paucimonas sp.]|nr:hypothetical protein [Paucimonas sp.]